MISPDRKLPTVPIGDRRNRPRMSSLVSGGRGGCSLRVSATGNRPRQISSAATANRVTSPGGARRSPCCANMAAPRLISM